MSDKSTAAINKIIDRFQSGDIGPVIRAALIRPPSDWPAAKWSFANRVLVYAQTDTLNCRGYRQWETAQRPVKKGESAAYIFAPLTRKVTDKKTEEEKTVVTGFSPIPVFPVDATEGEPMAEDFTPRELPALAPLTERLGITVTYAPLPEDRLGDYAPGRDRINLSTANPRTFYHEISHAIHNRVDGLKGTSPQRETIAEFAACVLMDLYEGTDTTGNAYHYIAAHSPHDPITAIMKALATVEKIINFIEAAGAGPGAAY